MLAWIQSILAILGVVSAAAPTVLPVIEQMLSGIGTFIATIASTLFGATAATEIQSLISEAEGIVQAVDADVPAVTAWLTNEIKTLEALFTLLPGLQNEAYARATIMKSRGISHTLAAKVVPVSHANVRVAEAAAAKKGRP